MNNYEFCAAWAARQGGKTLDYGCGAGDLIALMRRQGIDAHGCDVFYEGGNFAEIMVQSALPYIRRMEGDRIPFPDDTFDTVISNQVLEHVPNLETVIDEIARVLKPGGVSLNLFPYRGTLWEGHARIPLLHLLPRGEFRAYYACVMSMLPGFGLPLRGEPRLQRFRNKCKWIDDWTYYRTTDQIHDAFRRHFSVTHIEHDWLVARASAAAVIPAALRAFLARRLAGMIVVLHKL